MHNDNNSNNNENSRFSDNVYSDSWSTQAYETSPRRVHHRRDYYGSRNAVYSDYSSYGSLNSFGSFGSSSSSSPYSGRRYGGSRRYSNSYHARYDSRYDPFEGYEEDYDHCDGRNRRPPYVDAYSRPYYRDEEYEFEYEYNGFGEEYEEEFGVGDDVPWYRSSLRGQEGSSRSIIDGAGASGSRDDNRRNNNNSHPGSSRNLSTYAHTRSNAHTRTTYDDYGHPRRQTSSQSPSPPPPPIADCPSEEYLSIASQPSYTVNSVSSSSSSTSDTSPTTASAPRKLIILDLNGTLLVRVNRSVPHPRPYMPTFREYLLCEDTRSWLDTMVWSSAQPHNVEKMVRRCFFDERVLGEEGEGEGKSKEKEGGKGLRSFKDMWTGKLVAVWARDTLGLSRNDYSRKAKTVKDLAKVWSALSSSDSSADGTSHSHDARTTFLLDDSPDKVHLQPFNHVCIREYGVEDRERDVKIKMKELEMRDVRERELKEIEKEKEDRGEEGLSGEEADRTEKEENMLEEHSQTSTKAGVDAGTDIDTSVDPRANVDEPGSEATRDSENNEYVGGVVNMEGSEVAEELDTETDKRLQRRKEKKAKKKLEKKQKLVQGSIPSHRHEHTQKHNQEQEQKQVPSKSGCVDEHSSYDETLLAIIGILEAIKYETNVAGWIRAGGLWAASNPQIKDDLSTGTEIFVVPNHIPGRVRAESPTDAEVDEIEGLEELGELKSLEGLEGGDKVNEVRDADAADRANEIVEAPPTSSSPTPSPILKRTRPDDLPDYRIGSNGGGGERSWYLDSELPRSPSKKIRYSDPERSSSLLERIEGTGTVEAPTGNDAQTTTQVVVDMSISSSDSSSLLSSVAQPPSESTLLPFDPPAQLVHPLPQDIGEKQDPRVHKEVVSVRKAQEVETDINTQLESNNINAGNEVPTSREPPETAKMWFEDKATFDHWVSRGRSVLKEMGIKERDGIYVV